MTSISSETPQTLQASSSPPQTIHSSTPTDASPQTIHSSSAVGTVSSEPIRAMPAIIDMSADDDDDDGDHEGDEQTVEYISSDRAEISDESLDLIEARAESARLAQVAAQRRLELLEARARSSRSSRSSAVRQQAHQRRTRRTWRRSPRWRSSAARTSARSGWRWPSLLPPCC